MDNWKIWEKARDYGEVFYKRATSQLEEMESSKAVSEIIGRLVEKDDIIVDVGCGGGHYLVSLDRAIKTPFSYYGYDATEYYIELARKAFIAERGNDNPLRMKTAFEVGNIYGLPLDDNSADIVMCNNVLVHLPSIDVPLRELWRISRRYVIIRTLIGDVSFRIKQVLEPEKYNEDGEPENYHYLNIYSNNHIRSLISGLDGVSEQDIFADGNYDPDKIGNVNYKGSEPPRNLTTIVNGMQVNNYILMPWHFIVMKKAPSDDRRAK